MTDVTRLRTSAKMPTRRPALTPHSLSTVGGGRCIEYWPGKRLLGGLAERWKYRRPALNDWRERVTRGMPREQGRERGWLHQRRVRAWCHASRKRGWGGWGGGGSARRECSEVGSKGLQRDSCTLRDMHWSPKVNTRRSHILSRMFATHADQQTALEALLGRAAVDGNPDARYPPSHPAHAWPA